MLYRLFNRITVSRKIFEIDYGGFILDQKRLVEIRYVFSDVIQILKHYEIILWRNIRG